MNKQYGITLLLFFSMFFILNLAQAANSGDVVINEIAWGGTAASSSDEWLELFNTTNQAITLTNWTLNASDGIPSITLSGVIPPNTARKNS